MEQKNKNRARVKVAVFFILAIHGIGLMALLMQGCRREPAQQAMETNAPPPVALAPTNAVETSLPPVPATTNVAPVIDAAAAASAATASEYTVVQGDNFWTIGKKFNVSSKAIADANPGVDPAKLKIGQKLHIPPPTSPAATQTAAAGATATSDAEQTYTVKSGDNLLKLAAQFHTSVKAIRTANGLTTDRITVGQKLKIPKGSSDVASTNPATGVQPAH